MSIITCGDHVSKVITQEIEAKGVSVYETCLWLGWEHTAGIEIAVNHRTKSLIYPDKVNYGQIFCSVKESK